VYSRVLQPNAPGKERTDMKPPRPLSTSLAVGFAAVIVIAIALEGGVRYATSQATLGAIVLEGLRGPAAIGAALYLVAWAILRQSVLDPLTQVCMHIHDVGLGRLKPLPLRSDVLEVQSLIGVVDTMVGRLEQDIEGNGGLRLRENLESLREVARTIAPGSPEGAAEVLRDVAELEKAFVSAATTRSMSPIHI
jgi:hypothetical protein